jgi:phi13 family phage major tail protein
MSNKVKFGLRNVTYSKVTITAGEETYATPVAIPGAVNIALAPAGDTAEFFADDSLYFTQASNQGYTGDLEIALIPESFLKDILGLVVDDNGALVETADATTHAFALGFEVQGDDKGKKTWLYNCTCARPNQDAATKDKGITPTTDKLSLVVAPRLSDKKVKISMTLNETNATAYGTFFTSVYEAVPIA